MTDLMKVAIRNVGRNKRRTLITVITIFLGVVVSASTRGLLNGLQAEIRGSLTRKLHGDLQIHKAGYQDSLESNPFKLLIPSDPKTVEGIKASSTYKGHPEVTAVAPRLRIMALVNHQKSQTTTPLMITGIDSEAELAVCPRLATSIISGKMLDSRLEKEGGNAEDEDLGEARGLDSSPSPVTHAVRSEGYHQIMMSPSVMRGMGAEVGDEVVVLFQDKDNMQQALVTKIVSTVDVGMPLMSGRMAWMDLTSLQKTLNITGLSSELALRTTGDRTEDEVKNDLKKALPEDQVLETWLEIAGTFRDALALQNAIFSAILVIVFSIVVAAIVNTSLMTVIERTKEIGTLMALGYRRRHILLLFLGESAVIGATGGFLGMFTAVGLILTLHARGIAVTLPGQAVGTVLYPTITLSFGIFVFLLAVSAAIISAFIPAYRASHMRPVEALASN